jgi:hypothetical protein
MYGTVTLFFGAKEAENLLFSIITLLLFSGKECIKLASTGVHTVQ